MEHFVIELFNNMSLLTAILIGVGILLCVVEIFVPKIGVTGILGFSLVIFGFTSYYIDGYKIKHIITLLSIIAFVIAIFIMIELVLESKGIIKNPHRRKFRTISIQQSFNSLIGKVGKAYTNIDMGGTIDVDGKLYYALSDTFITQGSEVSVVAVDGNSLVVVKK